MVCLPVFLERTNTVPPNLTFFLSSRFRQNPNIQLRIKGDKQVSISERKKEINARRKRRETLRKMKSELPKADAAKKAVWAAKLRKMTPGAEMLIKEWGLE